MVRHRLQSLDLTLNRVNNNETESFDISYFFKNLVHMPILRDLKLRFHILVDSYSELISALPKLSMLSCLLIQSFKLPMNDSDGLVLSIGKCKKLK